MVLRKPYKFLIKHFKLIHLMLAIISGYLLVKTNAILSFFNDYLNNSQILIGSGTVNEYFNGIMTLFILLVIIGTIVILIIMKMKDKPIIFYIINLITYIFLGIIYVYDKSLLETLELRTIEVRTLKLASDLTLICFLVQTFNTIILSMRAVGFNIKKFDFNKDMDFEITENDNEEFELDVNIDKNKIKRNIKKNIRSLKYTYGENKFIINIIIASIIFISGINFYLNKEVLNKVYKKGEVINTSQFTYSLVDSYITDKSYRNNKITDNYLVVAKLKIKNNSTDKLSLETARVLLHVGKINYNPTTKYKNQLIDLGVDIENKNIKNEFEEYVITFEIPKNSISKEMILSYSDINNKTYNVKLNNINFDKNNKTEKANINETMNLEDQLFKNIEFKIKNIEINNKVKATYKFCETSKNCYNSYEYITPILTDNYNKVILKIESEINFNGEKIKEFNDLSDFIEKYGTIKYKINDTDKEMKTKIIEVNPTKSLKEGTYYFEVYEEIKDSKEIYLVLNIRNNTYEYKIK